MRTVRVGVIDENEIFRRGALACLREDESLIVVEGIDTPGIELDVIVTTAAGAKSTSMTCPLVICIPDVNRSHEFSELPNVAAVLPRRDLTPEQLVSAVRAAASGLRINPPSATPRRLDQRKVDVLRLLAEGADTREIATTLGYSERTIKSVIYEAERELGARNRAQAVAEAVRQDLI